MDDVRLSSPHSLERVDIVEHPKAAEGTRATGGVGSLRTAVQFPELSSGWIVADPELGLFFQRSDSRWPSGTKTTSGA